MTPYFGNGYRMNDITDGERLPVGGNLFLQGQKADIQITADLDRLSDVYAQADDIFSKIKHTNLRAWLNDVGADIDPALFARMYAFQQMMRNNGYFGEDADRRRFDLLTAGGASISSLFEHKCAMCAETSAVAQRYLKRHGYDAVFVNGAVHWGTQDGFTEFNAPHAYLLVTHGGKTVVYDPTNPIMFGGTQPIPSVFAVDSALLAAFEARAGSRASLMPLSNMVYKSKALYGVANPDCSYTDRDIVVPAAQAKTAGLTPPLRQSL